MVLCLAAVSELPAQVGGYLGKHSPDKMPDLRPAKPVHPASGNAEEVRKSIERLIDKLAEVSEPEPEKLNNLGEGPFSPVDDVKPPSLFYEPWEEFVSCEAIRNLASYGADAVPRLIAHLGDQRKTKIPTEKDGFPTFVWEYDYNRRRIAPSPKGIVHPDDFNAGRQEESADEYDVRVGDLCYVALGQIVNRRFNAVRFQPENSYYIAPVCHSPEFRATIIAEWGNLTGAAHKASLIADVRESDTPERAYGALRRLSYYYPDCVEQIAMERLGKPHYSWIAVYHFAYDELYQTASERDRRRLFEDAVQRHGKLFSEGLLCQLFSDHDWDKAQPKPKFKADPRKILTELYPHVDATKAYYPTAEPWGDQAGVFDALSWFPSEKIDRAAYDLFKQLGSGQFDPAEDDNVALACIRRLGGKGHDKEFGAYLSRRIPLIATEWNADELKAALALLRGETFQWFLEGTQVTDAQMARLKDLKNLQRLCISGPLLTNDRLKYLDSLVTLEHLSLDSPNITGEGLSHLRRLERLECLFLAGSTHVDDAGMVHLEALGKVRQLALSRTGITDKGLPHLSKLKTLETLWLENLPQITDAGMVYLNSLGRLKYLDLSGTSITDKGLAQLRSLSSLEYLGLRRNSMITKAGIEKLKAAIPSCRADSSPDLR
jgi:hypothetical protein